MPYKYDTKNCKHCAHCVKTDKGLYCSHREGRPKVTSGGWCIDRQEKVEKMDNDMIPVGTTVHINPEDIKWNNEIPIVFTITPNVDGRCEVHTVDKRAIEPRYFCNSNEAIDCMEVLTEMYNNKGYAVMFEVD